MSNVLGAFYTVALFVLTVLAALGVVSIPGVVLVLLWAPVALALVLLLVGLLAVALTVNRLDR